MTVRHAVAIGAILFGAGWTAATAQKPEPGGYILEYSGDVAHPEPGTHNGGGETIGYSFFKKAPKLEAGVPQARARKTRNRESAITSRRKTRSDYVLSGRGTMTIDGKSFEVPSGEPRC